MERYLKDFHKDLIRQEKSFYMSIRDLISSKLKISKETEEKIYDFIDEWDLDKDDDYLKVCEFVYRCENDTDEIAFYVDDFILTNGLNLKDEELREQINDLIEK
jgi:hypothetical protein